MSCNCERKVKFGVIGASSMGMCHIRSIAQHPKMELVAVCDKREERLELAKSETCVEKLYTNWRDLINDTEIEAVVICVPDQLHVEMTVAALEAGKEVICEKPMALTMEECEEMRAAEKRTGKRLMIGQICRHAPAFKLAKELIEKGEIGVCYFNIVT